MSDKKSAVLLAGALVAGMLAAPAALAAWNGTKFGTRVENLAVRTFDLAPADGIDAGYTMGDVTTTFTLRESYSKWQTVTGSIAAPDTLTITDGPSFGQASWYGQPGELAVSAQSDERALGGFNVSIVQTFVVTVAPRTAFVITGSTHSTGHAYGTQSTNYSGHYFRASIDAGGTYHNEMGINMSPHWRDIDQTDDFAVSFANMSDVARAITVQYRLSTEGYALVVPEPSTYMMLAAGLLGVAGRIRTARRNAAHSASNAG
ncbi:PEP-CTERM sorting domain-containing protein [[Empedobacter] haloabium]|uniref:PEP-CTERM sorting domain-containing protein n=1 Tax=[Empedobacter] haloabium TaxID=592317 RepID=A0ABZ1UH06_9BURK